MEMNRLGVSIVLVHLLFTFLVVCPGAKAMDDLRTPLRSASVERAENLTELIWAGCMLEMTSLKEAYKDLDIEVFGISGTNLFDGDNFQKLLSILPPQIQRELFECLKERVLVSYFFRDDESSSQWYLKLMRSLVSRQYRHAHLRRYLARVSEDPFQEMAQSLTAGTSRSLHSGFNVDETVIRSNLEEKSNKQDHTHISIIIAVVATAAVTFIITLLLFFFCAKFFGISFGNDYKDGNPLLGVQMSNSSDGSSNSTDFNGSYHNMSFQSYASNFSDNEVVVSLEGNVESDILNASIDRVGTLSTDFSNVDANVRSPPQKLPSLRKPPLPERKQSLPSTLRRLSLSNIRPLPSLPSAPPSFSSLTPPLPPSPPPRKPPFCGGGPPPPPPPITIGTKPGVCPPPLPKFGAPPGSGIKGDTNASRTKLKPFFWDKVLASPGHLMVWNQLKSGSFQVSEEMIESLFGYIPPDKSKLDHQKASSSHERPQLIQIIDAKKAHNLSILMRALNVTTDEVCDALVQGNELPPELLETLLKMAPTNEEELKLRLFSGELSQLHPAERFLKVLVEIPFAYKRMEALLFMCILKEEVETIRESFLTLEAACNELRNSRLFLKLLEAVLKTGNRMNDGTFRGGADAFKLDTLLKLSDVKAVDGKVTLLHFVVVEIIKSEGIRASRGANFKSDNLPEIIVDDDNEEQMRALGLQVVSGLTGQMEHVKKVAVLDSDFLSASVSKLGSSMAKNRNFLNREMKDTDENNRFYGVLKSFVEEFGDVVISLVEEEKRIWELIKNTADYFHGKPGKEEGLRLFSIVRDFLIMLDKACRQVEEKFKKPCSSNHTQIDKKDPPSGQEKHSLNESCEPPQHQETISSQQLFQAITDRRVCDDSSSDDEVD